MTKGGVLSLGNMVGGSKWGHLYVTLPEGSAPLSPHPYPAMAIASDGYVSSYPIQSWRVACLELDTTIQREFVTNKPRYLLRLIPRLATKKRTPKHGGSTSSSPGSHCKGEEVSIHFSAQLQTSHASLTQGTRYDRQLRLWGATGQVALENSHILLINSGPGVVGIETLKNLVLPGIGNFTIQDSTVVSEADLGVNFFLEEEHLGGFRAEHTCNLLKELNPDVIGSFITEVLIIVSPTQARRD